MVKGELEDFPCYMKEITDEMCMDCNFPIECPYNDEPSHEAISKNERHIGDGHRSR